MVGFILLRGVVEDLALRQNLLEFSNLTLGEVGVVVESKPLNCFRSLSAEFQIG